MSKMGLLAKKSKRMEKSQVNQEENQLSTFLELVEKVSVLISQLKNDVDKVKNLQENILCSPTTSQKEKRELEKLTDSIMKTAFTDIKTKLKEIGKYLSTDESDQVPSVQIRIVKTQHDSLIKNFQELIQDFQLSQANYRDKCKERLERQLQIAGMDQMSNEDFDKVLEDENFSVFTQGIITETADAKRMLTEVTNRHNEFIKVEKSIQEIHQLTLEIANLVESQGEKVEKIVIQVEKVQVDAEKGVEELKEAKKKKKKARRIKFCCAGIGVIVIIVVVVLIVVLP